MLLWILSILGGTALAPVCDWRGVMESAFGWTQIARSDVAKAAELLKGAALGVRDEIGFLSLHQGFADRFFPGTSVLQTRLRYVLFVAWQIQDLNDQALKSAPGRAGKLTAEQMLKRQERNLVLRLKQARDGVIGLYSDNHQPAQPPSTIYWTALRLWGVLNPNRPGVWPGRGEILGKIDERKERETPPEAAHSDVLTEPTFYGLPPRPKDWHESAPLNFRLPSREQKYLCNRIAGARRIAPAAADKESLLARLATSKATNQSWLSGGFDAGRVKAIADSVDRTALDVAAAASSLSHIGRAVYDALVEQMLARDRRTSTLHYGDELKRIIAKNKSTALNCKLDEVEVLIGSLDETFRSALGATLDWLRKPDRKVQDLWHPYWRSEDRRKDKRARLSRTEIPKGLRAVWLDNSNRQTDPYAAPLNYRWHRVGRLLDDLHGVNV
jgi:hypothetical protein